MRVQSAALLIWLAILPVTTAGSAAAPASRLQSRAWVIMGTVLEVTVHADKAVGARAFQAAYSVAARIDSLMSLYRPESELSRVNRDACAEPVSLSPETSEVLDAAIRFRAVTSGAFDVTIKPAMDLWGFYRKAGHVPSYARVDSVLRLIGPKSITWDRVHRTVRLLKPGAAIDLGGIAKGYAVDRMVETLLSNGIENGIVNLGGNIRAFGAPPENPGGWPVGVRNPVQPDSILLVLDLKNQSMASSGVYEKYTMLDGRKYGHILDPRTAAPVERMAGTTVIAPDAMTADILSTALFVLGPDRGRAVAASMPGVECFLVADGTPGMPRSKGTGVFADVQAIPP